MICWSWKLKWPLPDENLKRYGYEYINGNAKWHVGFSFRIPQLSFPFRSFPFHQWNQTMARMYKTNEVQMESHNNGTTSWNVYVVGWFLHLTSNVTFSLVYHVRFPKSAAHWTHVISCAVPEVCSALNTRNIMCGCWSLQHAEHT